MKRNESIWKKEITLRRPRDPDAEPGEQVTPSIWKKEITLRRPQDAVAGEQARESIWTKEITLRRPRDADSVSSEHARQSIWTRELQLGKRARDVQPEADLRVTPPTGLNETRELPKRPELWDGNELQRTLGAIEAEPAPEPSREAAVAPEPVLKTALEAAPASGPALEAALEAALESAPAPGHALEAAPAPDPAPDPPERVAFEDQSVWAAATPVIDGTALVFSGAGMPDPPVAEPAAHPDAALAPEPHASTTAADAAEIPSVPKPRSVRSWARGQRARPAPAAPRQPISLRAAVQGMPAKLQLLTRHVHPPSVSWRRGRNADGVAANRSVGNIVGLHIGSSQISAALVHNNGAAELQRLVRTPLAPDTIVAGEVRDADGLARALKGFFSEHKLPRKEVRLGIATNRIGVRVLDVPALDNPGQFENAVRFRAQEVLPIPLVDAVLDHVVLDEIEQVGDDPRRRVLVVFAHRELVDGYAQACKSAGLKLAGIDLDAFALLRALSGDSGDRAKTAAAIVAVSIGRERTIFAVSDGSVCEFARVFEWGGANLDAALALALGITTEEAVRVKETLEFPPGQEEAGRKAMWHELGVLAREILASLRFYQSRAGSLDIAEVLITGGCSELVGIEGELTSQLGVPVRIGDPLRGVKLGPKVTRPAEVGSLAIAVGLGIER